MKLIWLLLFLFSAWAGFSQPTVKNIWSTNLPGTAVEGLSLGVPLDMRSTVAGWYVATTLTNGEGTNVTYWPDMSGHGNHLNNNKGNAYPIFHTNKVNGFPAVSVTVDNWPGSLATVGNSLKFRADNFAAFIVARVDVDTYPDFWFWSMGQGAGYDSANLRGVAFESGRKYLVGAVGGAAYYSGINIGATATGFDVISVNSSREKLEYRINGVVVQVRTNAVSTLVSNVCLFSDLTGATTGIGDVAEMLICTNYLSDAQIQAEGLALANKYGLAYWTPPKMFVHQGSSLTDGFGLTSPKTNTYPYQLGLLLGTNWTMHNIGRPSQPTAELAIEFPIHAEKRLNFTQSRNVALLWEMSNALYFGTNANQAWIEYSNYCYARFTNGWTVVTMSVLPRDVSGSVSNASWNQSRTNVNASLSNNWQKISHTFVNIATQAQIGVWNASTNTLYYSDGVHLTPLGNAIIATNVYYTLTNRLPYLFP